MKRILAFMLVIVVITAMAVPAFAVDTNNFAKYNDVELPIIPESLGSNYHLIICEVSYGGYQYVLYPALIDTAYYSDVDKFVFFDMDIPNETRALFYKAGSNSWEISSDYGGASRSSVPDGTVIWTNKNINYRYSDEVYFNGTEPIIETCDGSTCPATDVNVDGICDDCGKMLSLRSLTYPAFPSVDGSNKHYALVETKYSGVDAYMYSVFTSDATYDIRGETPSTVYQIAVDGVADYIQYVTTDGQSWVEIQNSSVNNQSVGSGIVSQTTVIASTFDWYNEEGERFFPVPLWEEMEQVTQGEMENLRTETGGTMKILVVCGVGLMACLVVLSLFGKRSLIFRS